VSVDEIRKFAIPRSLLRESMPLDPAFHDLVVNVRDTEVSGCIAVAEAYKSD
jgi:hypothetical protein